MDVKADSSSTENCEFKREREGKEGKREITFKNDVIVRKYPKEPISMYNADLLIKSVLIRIRKCLLSIA